MNNDLPINRNVMKDKEVNKNSDNNKFDSKTNDFAAAFPDWNLTPPAVVVKRVRRGI